MKIQKIDILGMILDQWTHKDCKAEFGVGDGWATLYSIESKTQGKGYAQELLKSAKEYYGARGKTFGSSVALNPAMKHILQKLKIKEYE